MSDSAEARSRAGEESLVSRESLASVVAKIRSLGTSIENDSATASSLSSLAHNLVEFVENLASSRQAQDVEFGTILGTIIFEWDDAIKAHRADINKSNTRNTNLLNSRLGHLGRLDLNDLDRDKDKSDKGKFKRPFTYEQQAVLNAHNSALVPYLEAIADDMYHKYEQSQEDTINKLENSLVQRFHKDVGSCVLKLKGVMEKRKEMDGELLKKHILQSMIALQKGLDEPSPHLSNVLDTSNQPPDCASQSQDKAHTETSDVDDSDSDCGPPASLLVEQEDLDMDKSIPHVETGSSLNVEESRDNTNSGSAAHQISKKVEELEQEVERLRDILRNHGISAEVEFSK